MLDTRDKYGNACASGGLRIAGRLNLVKQNSNDITILTPNNHNVTVEDLQNGSYAVKVALLMACSVKLIVNMDKDLPGTSGELPAMSLTFVSAAAPPAPPAPPPALPLASAEDSAPAGVPTSADEAPAVVEVA